MKKQIYTPNHGKGPEYVNDSNCPRWESRERGVVVGTLRMIDEVLFYAWAVDVSFTFAKPRVTWLPVEQKQIVK